jgi:hypothetical protein
MGLLAGKARVIAPVEEAAEWTVGAPPQAPSAPLVLPAASEVDNAGVPNTALGVPLDPLRMARQAVEGLLAKTHDVHEEIWRAVESLLADLNVKLSRECAARIAQFEKEIQERGRYQTATVLDQIDLEAESRMAARVDHALDKTQEAERRSSQVLNEQVGASRASLMEIANTAKEELQRRTAICMEDLQVDASKRLNDLKAEHENKFAALTQKTADALNERLAKQADHRFQAFQERVKHLTDETSGQFERKLNALTETAVASVTNEIQAAVAHETSTYLIDILHKRLDQLASSLKE